ncbi:serine hydrolase domain-containing protein [Bacillus swezeyi]|uniref:Class A beta-lactamase-related serine hydrolase n=1 Tax=Bacillus swezeyi TaxID=1925020 RepID=A0A5M8RIJ2_9BACI|nr:serine hydrolase domain-containing protein [Bacillus swezeyi]KAA6447671.1 class A beta-lactamase-related serine hydrolase [Bacillus swezeyi]TYS34254.1 beta-lactamase family protein [Bacillus swezeyi]
MRNASLKILTAACLGLLVVFMALAGSERAETSDRQLEELIEKKMEAGGIPGLTAVAVKGNQVILNKGFGYADSGHSRPVTSSTLFEMGSTSKAFTALGVLELVRSGKVNLQAPVSQYIKGFYALYHGEKQEITVEQLMYHTSGIPFLSIADIQAGSEKDALRRTAEGMKGIELSHMPGTEFEYATINYDVLGYIIEKVSGQPYEQYMEEHIFHPLGLSHTYAGRQALNGEELSEGFKIGFFKSRAYQAPDYRGNTPAGYIMTDGEDLAKWLQYQLLNKNNDDDIQKWIEKSHKPNVETKTEESDVYYGFGWSVKQKNGRTKEIFHAGSNPNFSSFLIIRPKEKTAVGILANMNSAYPEHIAREVLNAVTDSQNKDGEADVADPFRFIDVISVILLIIFIFILVIIIFRLSVLLKKVKTGIKVWQPLRQRNLIVASIWSLVLAAGLFVPRLISILLFNGLPWKMIYIWGPFSLIYLASAYYILIVLSCTFGLMKSLTSSHTAKRSEAHDI